MNTALYTIRTLSNLHVGSGEINFDIIDNQVQRDEAGNPHINSSSLKGALREHFGRFDPPQEADQKDSAALRYIFGPGNSEDNAQTGAYRFFAASLLSRPLRSDKTPYVSATTPELIKGFLETVEDFGIVLDPADKSALETLAALAPSEGNSFVLDASLAGAKIEDLPAAQHQEVSEESHKRLQALIGHPIAIINDAKMRSIALPVQARNFLENGESKNLWYEEVVPKRSRFYFVLGTPSNEDVKDQDRLSRANGKFEASLEEIVQIGANATVGYGYTRFKKVSL